jgi:hypothetical protein
LKLPLIKVQVARDIIETFEAVLAMLDEISNGLPTLETYIDIFGFSEIRLLEAPLIKIYAELISFGIQAVKLFDRSMFRE